jgi:hypothetical protein
VSHEGVCGRESTAAHISYIQHYMDVSGQLCVLVAEAPQKHPVVLTEERPGGLQNQSGVEWKGGGSLFCSGNWTVITELCSV